MTNREKVNQMSNEEFVSYINENGICGFCGEINIPCSIECEKNIKQWLESEVGEMDNKQDIKIEARLQFDYKLAIESEICSCKEKIKEYEDKLREDKERIEMYKGMITGLQNANYFFDEYKKNEVE